MKRIAWRLAPLCVAAALFVASAAPVRAQYVVGPPVVSYYYTPPAVTYYQPTVTYYTPTYVSGYTPTVSYYAAPTVTYYAAPAVSYYAAPSSTAVTTTNYGLFGRPRSTTTYYYTPVVVRP